MGNYYSLVAGLPDLLPEDTKLRYQLTDFRHDLEENLSRQDLRTLGIFFLKYDNSNLLELYKNPEAELKAKGTLETHDLLDLIRLFKEEDQPRDNKIIPYFRTFLPALLSEQALVETMSWEDQLTSLYYDYATQVDNHFISAWFSMNLHLINVLTALNCRKYGLNIEASILGTNEVSDALRTSHAKDFGLLPIFPEIDEIIKIAEIEDFFERERKIDLFRWNWLEENGFFHYFDVERLFIYLVKLDMLERWTLLEKTTGQKIFRDLVLKMKKAFEFPSEFKLVKYK